MLEQEFEFKKGTDCRRQLSCVFDSVPPEEGAMSGSDSVSVCCFVPHHLAKAFCLFS